MPPERPIAEKRAGANRHRPLLQLALVGDIGGTRARFGLWQGDGLRADSVRSLACADFTTFAEATRCYLEGIATAPRWAALAVAGPVTGDTVEMPNRGWSFSIKTLERELELERLVVVNDFVALVQAIPFLQPSELRVLRRGRRGAGGTIAAIGPGTGLGMGALVSIEGDWRPLASEGGHSDLAATTELEWSVLRELRRRFDPVLKEDVLSGRGLRELYAALCRLHGEPEPGPGPEDVVAAATSGSSVAVTATELFSGWLGAVAGDLVLTFAAWGGLYLGGGMVHHLGEHLDASRLVDRFVGKGPYRRYLEQVPIDVIQDHNAALRGAAFLLERASAKGSTTP